MSLSCLSGSDIVSALGQRYHSSLWFPFRLLPFFPARYDRYHF